MDSVQRTFAQPKKECSATVSKDTPLHTAFTTPHFWRSSAKRVVALKLKGKTQMTFKDHIDAMKFREDELRRRADLCITKAQSIQRERIELELFIDREQKKEDTCKEERLKSLINKGS
jgi:hypothetical protein